MPSDIKDKINTILNMANLYGSIDEDKIYYSKLPVEKSTFNEVFSYFENASPEEKKVSTTYYDGIISQEIFSATVRDKKYVFRCLMGQGASREIIESCNWTGVLPEPINIDLEKL